MGLAGLWHGAAWHFVIWGLWHGTGLAAHRIWTLSPIAARLGNAPGIRPAYVAGTFLFVSIGWVLFASPTIATAVVVFKNLL
jgi:alginate O-acetyltransferase complex protein AlgI